MPDVVYVTTSPLAAIAYVAPVTSPRIVKRRNVLTSPDSLVSLALLRHRLVQESSLAAAEPRRREHALELPVGDPPVEDAGRRQVAPGVVRHVQPIVVPRVDRRQLVVEG